MAIQLSHIYEIACETLNETLSSSKKIGFKNYNTQLSSYATVIDYNINLQETINKDRANIILVLTYNKMVLIEDETTTLTSVEKSDTFIFLNTEADNLWTRNMVNKVWDGDYPSTIALSNNTKELFFVFVRLHGIEFVRFATLEDDVYEHFCEDIVELAPFQIKISPRAMFMYIDGQEGTRFLKENINVELNCIRKYKIRAN